MTGYLDPKRNTAVTKASSQGTIMCSCYDYAYRVEVLVALLLLLSTISRVNTIRTGFFLEVIS